MQTDRIQFTAPLEPDVATVDLETADLGSTEILGETLYTLISPGTELLSVETADDEEFPIEVGYASVDRVLETGADIDDIETGTRVMNTGRHASHHRIDTQESPVVPVPDGLASDVVLFARFCGVSMSALQTTPVHPPANVAVFGLGLVGNLAAQLSGVFGFDVVGFDPIAARRATADRCGVPTTLDPTARDAGPSDRRSGDRSCELIFECSGTSDAIVDALDLAAIEGEIVQIGVPWTETNPDVSAYQVLNPLFRKHLTVRSGWEWQIPRFATEHDRFSHFENYAHAMKLLDRDRLAVDELVTHRVAPDEAGAAYEGLANEREEYLGVLIDWT